MQLKKDTDIALRILYCLYQNNSGNDLGTARGLTLLEIATQTETPLIVIRRVCESLKARGIITLLSEFDSEEISYCASKELLEHSMLDVVEAIEGNCQIFAVFDQRSLLYRDCAKQIQKIQNKTETLLNNAKLGSIFKSGR